MNDPKSADESAAKWLKLLKQYPISWVFVGLMIVLAADGGVRIAIGKGSFNFIPPVSLNIKMIIRLIGFGITIGSATFIFGTIFKAPRACNFVGGLLFIFTFSTLSWGLYTSSLPYKGAKAWYYDPVKSYFWISLYGRDLAKRSGDSVVFILRKKDDSRDRYKDNSVVISKPYTISGGIEDSEYRVNAPMKPVFANLGDVVECYVYILPKTAEISEFTCLSDVASSGAFPFLDEPVAVPAAISDVNAASVEFARKQLEEIDKK